MRPLPYKFSAGSVVLGQYMVAQRTGALAATPGALDQWARIRWNPGTNAKCVLTKLRVGLTVITAVTTTVQTILQASIARSFSVDHSAAITNISMVGDSGKMHKGMGSSLMGTSGPGVATTVTISGQTLTLDPAPFAIAPMPLLSSTNSTGTAVLLSAGNTTPMVELYNWQQMGGHPPTLSSLEGIVIQNLLAGHASGTMALEVEWSWAEVINPFGNV